MDESDLKPLVVIYRDLLVIKPAEFLQTVISSNKVDVTCLQGFPE